jgi:hypothetical protein
MVVMALLALMAIHMAEAGVVTSDRQIQAHPTAWADQEVAATPVEITTLVSMVLPILAVVVVAEPLPTTSIIRAEVVVQEKL